jgi:hypothetical protein
MMRKARHLIELWQSIGLGRVPTRDRFKPNNFPTLLPHLFGADVAERLEDYKIALAGSAVEKSYGRPLIGVSFAELDLGPQKEEIVEEYHLCATKRVAIASRHQMRMVDEGVLELQRVLLPFDSLFKGGVGHVIGWYHMSPAPKRGIKGAVVRWTTEERQLIPAGT